MIKLLSFLLLLLFPIIIHAQFGPGGVGNSTNNGLWLKADDLTLSNGAPVAAWNDRSGNGNNAGNSLTNEQPVFRTSSAINNRPSVYFDGVLDQMIIADDDILDGSSGITFYTVIRPSNLDTGPRGILGKRTNQSTSTNYAYTFFFFNSNKLYVDLDRQNNRFDTGPITFLNLNNYMLGFDFDGGRQQSVRSRILSAGNIIKESTESSTTIPNSNEPLVLGGLNRNYSNGGQPRLGGDYAEVIHYNRALNTAERKIVENYLGAKYDITIANDLYNHEATYAGEVAGIGQDDASNSHSDAQGSAIVRINSPSNLSDGDFLLWGHNESSVYVYDTLDVDGTTIESRMSRVWALDKTNDVGTVTVIFDLSVFSPITPSDVRLLIDRNGNGFTDNDVVPITGSISGSSITFSGVNFQDNDKFTLGSINFDQTPLPVELTDFYLNSNTESVDVMWTTASELNADYYHLLRSKDGKSFEYLAEIAANGNTSKVSNYKFTDYSPYSGVSYYQLVQVDFDGRKTDYAPISVNREQEQSFALVPNPSNGAFRLKSPVQPKENTEVFVYSSLGELIHSVTFSPEELNSKHIDLGLKSGVYFIKINQKNEQVETLKLIIR
ncbi:T9SS type A sorting domain-containing protein [Brumimicrobium oceani]|uniref:Uncharacterized protein n=1 Tax=Brumimicrobium oceani TaxID=2100725 RepID=A0A2U2XBZ3_9FLAO|nr:T9SS type A sorting domain-containing protein [Brumimicrobium oceani]PWH85298.1 hypothetical protein DIT68_10190 [Brumimicrobium oceani]